MAEQRASGRLQAARLVLALVFLAVAVWCLLTRQWVVAVLMLVGVAGALAAFRRGTQDKELAKDYAKNRLIGGAIGLGVFLVAAALGLLDYRRPYLLETKPC